MKTTTTEKIFALVKNKLDEKEQLELLQHLRFYYEDNARAWESRLIFRTFCAAVWGSVIVIPLAVFSKSLFLGSIVGSVFTTLVFYGLDQLGIFLSKKWTKKDGK